MKIFYSGVLRLCALFVALGFSGSVWAAPPVEAFGNLPAMSRPALSPDGKHLAAIEPINGHPVLTIFSLDAPPGTPPQAFGAQDTLPESLLWVNDDRLLVVFSAVVNVAESNGMHLRRRTRIVSISISGGPPIVPMKTSTIFQYNLGQIGYAGRDPKDADFVYLTAFNKNDKLTLYRASVSGTSVEPGEEGSLETMEWLLDSESRPVGRIDGIEGITANLVLHTDSGWRDAFTFDLSHGSEDQFDGVTADNSSIAVERYGDRNTIGLDAFPIAGNNFSATLFSNPNYDIDHSVIDPWNGTVVGAAYMADKMEFTYFDPKLAATQRALEKAFPGETVELVSWDKARANFLVATETPREPRIYNLFNAATGQFRPLASEYPSLRAADLGEMRPYPYKARDGLDIPAYLTLPPGRVAKNLPTVIFLHGGPEARDGLQFDWWAQFMASRGYAVLQPNFRGSAGYGYKFLSAGFKQWGRMMQDDISYGVAKLVADGIADPKRICIVGASYGGYAALAGATFTPDLYACAVSVAGVSDIASVIGNAKEHGAEIEWPYWEQRIGSVFTDADFLRAASPAWSAQKVRAPILLIHCDHDITVPIGQSIQEQNALLSAGKSVQFVTIEGDDHYLKQAQTRIRVLREIDTFLKAHIGN